MAARRGGDLAPPLLRIALVALLVLAVAPAVALAADPEAGRRKAEPCLACHGPGGNATNPVIPSLAGQVATYLHWQLVLYRDRRRADPQMAPIAAALGDADMADLAAWFASQRPAPPPAPRADAARVESGRRLVETYHCNQCHGHDLGGRDYAPRLRGLSREYLLAQMRGFKARTRGELDGSMAQAAQPVADTDVEPLVEYLATLR